MDGSTFLVLGLAGIGGYAIYRYLKKDEPLHFGGHHGAHRAGCAPCVGYEPYPIYSGYEPAYPGFDY